MHVTALHHWVQAVFDLLSACKRLPCTVDMSTRNQQCHRKQRRCSEGATVCGMQQAQSAAAAAEATALEASKHARLAHTIAALSAAQAAAQSFNMVSGPLPFVLHVALFAQ